MPGGDTPPSRATMGTRNSQTYGSASLQLESNQSPSPGRMVAHCPGTAEPPGAFGPQLENRLPTDEPVGPPDQNWSPLLVLGADQRHVLAAEMSLAPSQRLLVTSRLRKRFSVSELMRVSVSPFALHACWACPSLNGPGGGAASAALRGKTPQNQYDA